MQTLVKELQTILTDAARIPAHWRLQAIVNDDNLTYLASHAATKEALIVDPMREDQETLLRLAGEMQGYRFLAVIDTHTHADHVSCAASLAETLRAPLIMHEKSPSRRVQLRASRDLELPTAAGPLKLLLTPGHAPDCITPVWGPFLFGGDLLLYGDTGRDDLPGGDPEAHYESLQKIKAHAQPETIFLPGHDCEGDRASSWKTQLEVNPGLSQDRESFVREAAAYVGPSPRQLKEALFENSK